jgi:hypothetical protein
MFILLLTTSCKKEQPYMNDAIITGSDMRMCVCCGGLMITFNGETKPYTGDFKLIENSADLGITEKDTFPIYVKVDWKVDTTNICNHIIITRFKRR